MRRRTVAKHAQNQGPKIRFSVARGRLAKVAAAVGIAAATLPGIGAFFAGYKVGHATRPLPSRPPVSASVSHGVQAAKQVPVAKKVFTTSPVKQKAGTAKREEPKPITRQPIPQQQGFQKQLLRYTPGLSGKQLAKSYGIKFTSSFFTRSQVTPDLLHDIKVLVRRECAKYNGKCELNPDGTKTLVDPYEALAIIEHESGYNPNAYRAADKDTGLGQLIPAQINQLAKMKMPVKISDAYDPGQNVAGIVRTLVWYATNPSVKQHPTTFRRFAAYRIGKTGAADMTDRTGNRYAKKVEGIWQRLKNERAFEGY